MKKVALTQACQTQTTSRAANGTKTAERAAKLQKKIQSGLHYINLQLVNDLRLLYNSTISHILVLKICLSIQI